MSQDISECDDKILARFRAGESPRRIGKAFNLRSSDVCARLADLGEDAGKQRAPVTLSIWEMDEDERRVAIARKAARNASKQLVLNGAPAPQRKRRPRPAHVYRVPDVRVHPEWVERELRWTDAARDEVMRLLEAGYTFTEIGKAIGCTRNAINGMVTRLRAKEAA